MGCWVLVAVEPNWTLSHGEGTHRMTKVLHKATYKVSNVVHDVMDKRKKRIMRSKRK
jgi:hypothetical protein